MAYAMHVEAAEHYRAQPMKVCLLGLAGEKRRKAFCDIFPEAQEPRI